MWYKYMLLEKYPFLKVHRDWLFPVLWHTLETAGDLWRACLNLEAECFNRKLTFNNTQALSCWVQFPQMGHKCIFLPLNVVAKMNLEVGFKPCELLLDHCLEGSGSLRCVPGPCFCHFHRHPEKMPGHFAVNFSWWLGSGDGAVSELWLFW